MSDPRPDDDESAFDEDGDAVERLDPTLEDYEAAQLDAELAEEEWLTERSYFNVSRSLSASLLFVLPLLAVYELGVLTDINAAAVWVKTPMSWMRRHPIEFVGVNATLILNGFFMLAVVVAAVRLSRRDALHAGTFMGMMAESGAYALLLGPVALLPLAGRWHFPGFALDMSNLWVKLVISSGAGLYEELLFRFILMGVVFLVAEHVLRMKRPMAGLLALVVSGAVFSVAHFVSPAEEANMGAFLYRLMAGMVLGVIFLTRGFGVAVWTHALYDVYVLCLTPQQ